MKSTPAVNFKTFYFLELLETIRESGAKKYDKKSTNYLKKFVEYLQSEKTAQEGIEKIAMHPSTSDLAIFFSDLLDHLHKATPDESMAKLSGYTRDFLEIFEVVLQSDDWKAVIDKEMSAVEMLDEQLEELYSLQEYCQHVIEEKIDATVEDLPEELGDVYKEYLSILQNDPEAAENLGSRFSEDRMAEFLALHQEVQEAFRNPEISKSMEEFEKNVESWAHLFRDFLTDHFDEAKAVFHPEKVETETIEQPFEELFEQTEDTIEFAPEEELEEPVSDELGQLAEELAHRKAAATPTLSEEDKERRKFLRDYIINEVNSFADEVLGAVDQLIESPEDSQIIARLSESLKGLKDLGQIHAYPGIEKSADQLLQIFNQVQADRQPLTEAEKPVLESLFNLMPEYIDAAIAEKPDKSLKKIKSQISQLRAQLFIEENVIDIKSADTLEASFQDVVSRYAGIIEKEIARGVNEVTPQALAPVFINLLYWSELLLQNNTHETVRCVQKLLTPENFERLSPEDKQLISDVVKSWESAYVSETPDTWENYHQQLNEMLLGLERAGVGVDEALQAFKDVALRQLREFTNGLRSTTATLPEIVTDHLPGLFQGLQDNSFLIGNDSLEILFRMLDIKLKSFDLENIRQPQDFTDNLIRFLGELEAEIHSLPDMVQTEKLLREFDTLLGQPEFAPETTAEEAETGFMSSEEEIQEVFKIEAGNYINELSENTVRLHANPNDKSAWREMGISTHTLKGSAQMVGRDDIAQLAEPLNNAIEMVENDDLPVEPELLSILESFTKSLKERIENRQTDSDEIARLNEYIARFEPKEAVTEEEFEAAEIESAWEPEAEKAQAGMQEEVSEEFAEEFPIEIEDKVQPETAETPVDEDLIYLEERDPELLEIFRSEVTNNFDIVERNLANLEKFSYDKEALRQGERAVHEIRAAAKMLGIHEISSIADKLETIFELLILHKVDDFDKVIPVTRRAMLVIRELTTKHSVRRNLYDEVLENLVGIIESPADAQISIGSEAPPPVSGVVGTTGREEEQAAEIFEVPLEEPTEVTPQVLELYIQESREQLDDINYILLKLEKTPENEELQHHLMRCMHTLKGSSGMVYAHKIERLSHCSEDILEKNIRAKQALPPDLFNLLFETVDEIKYLLNEIEENGKEKGRNSENLLNKLGSYYQEAQAEKEVEPMEEKETGEKVEEEPVELLTIGKKKAVEAAGAKETYLRLNINRMNHLLNMAAELVISNNQFKNQLDRLKNFIPLLNTNLKVFRDTEDYLNTMVREGKHLQEALNPLIENKPGTKESLKKQIDNIQRVLKNVKNMQDEITSITHMLKDNSKTYDENLEKINKLSNELLDDIMQARLVPINLLFQRFHRPIRDLANQLKKQIRLSISGEDTELDRTLVDELHEPLLHLIRNAIDHGLETAKERKALGKDPEGLLEIKASRDRNQVIIDISDDGSGIDLENVKENAIAKGLLTAEDAEHMSEQELFEYLFYPGFSTAKETTLVSGRGVGLDAVKAQIEKAKGDIRTYTEKGKGTTFSIRVPISLSVIQSMLVDVSGHVYSIPLMQVEETLNVNGQDLLSEEDRYYITYREKKIPVVQLSHLLRLRDIQLKAISAEINYPVIMVQDEGNRVALLVDKIIRREEILIKSLGPGLKRLRYISGGSIMVDGQVVLVLDIPQIIQDIIKGVKLPAADASITRIPVKEKKASATAGGKRKRKLIEGRKPVALVVDDSLSIRKYLSSLLMQKGFVTETARNGYEALELLNKQEFDIMVTDLEMPKLSGYELIETLRYDQRFMAFPIIVLTGRAGENFRQLTAELGADAYIIKPFKDRELFEQIDKFIEIEAR